MRRDTAARLASTVFFAFATLLVAYGLFGLSRFAWHSGMYVDDRLIVFDNGVYPFFWGCLLLVIGQLLHLQRRRQFMGTAAIAGLLVFIWKRVTVPTLGQDVQELFPDAELLNELIFVCVVMLGLALSDRYVQRVIDYVVIRPFRMLMRKE